MTNYIYDREYVTNDMSRQIINEGVSVNREFEVRPGIKIIATPYTEKEGYYYIVKNEGAQFDTPFVGDFEQLKKRMGVFVTQGIEDEEEFLKLFKEVES